jgi:hypothetical protein
MKYTGGHAPVNYHVPIRHSTEQLALVSSSKSNTGFKPDFAYSLDYLFNPDSTRESNVVEAGMCHSGDSYKVIMGRRVLPQD